LSKKELHEIGLVVEREAFDEAEVSARMSASTVPVRWRLVVEFGLETEYTPSQSSAMHALRDGPVYPRASSSPGR